jgi:hypothetical protein
MVAARPPFPDAALSEGRSTLDDGMGAGRLAGRRVGATGPLVGLRLRNEGDSIRLIVPPMG